jgi:hypothetical protein
MLVLLNDRFQLSAIRSPCAGVCAIRYDAGRKYLEGGVTQPGQDTTHGKWSADFFTQNSRFS